MNVLRYNNPNDLDAETVRARLDLTHQSGLNTRSRAIRTLEALRVILRLIGWNESQYSDDSMSDYLGANKDKKSIELKIMEPWRVVHIGGSALAPDGTMFHVLSKVITDPLVFIGSKPANGRMSTYIPISKVARERDLLCDIVRTLRLLGITFDSKNLLAYSSQLSDLKLIN